MCSWRSSIKTSTQNRDKLTPSPFVRNGSTPLSPYPFWHTINFEKSKIFYSKKYGRPHLKNPLSSCPQWTTPSPWLRTSFMNGPLTKIFESNRHVKFLKLENLNGFRKSETDLRMKMEQNKPRLRLGDAIFWNRSASEISGFCVFSNTSRRVCANFFSGLRRKHLLITTCIENTAPGL